MKPVQLFATHAFAVLMIATAAPAFAGPGHDHGDAAATPTGTASPRFSAQSEMFELTGIVKDKTIVLYLDEFASNAPVPRATIELELQPRTGAPLKLKAASAADGAFAVTLAAPLAEGEYAVTATVRAEVGGKSVEDLLSGNLGIHSDVKHAAESGSHQGLWIYGGLGSALAAILGLVAWITFRAMRGRRLGVRT